jgi:hypothetical protein
VAKVFAMGLYSVDISVSVRIAAIRTEKTLDVVTHESGNIICYCCIAIDSSIAIFKKISSITEPYCVVGIVYILLPRRFLPGVDMNTRLI